MSSAPIDVAAANAAMSRAFLAGARPVGYKSYLAMLACSTSPEYLRTATLFNEWCMKNGKEPELTTLTLYMRYLHDEKKITAKSLWSRLSHLRVFFQYCVTGEDGKVGINLKRDCPEVEHCLKQWQKSEMSKQAATFTKEEVEKILSAPNDEVSLLQKAALILGLHGCLRRAEIRQLRFEHLTYTEDGEQAAVIVKVFRRKQSGPKKLSTFAVVGKVAVDILVSYIACFAEPDRTGALFRKLLPPAQDSPRPRGSKQVLGINSLGAIPYQLALRLGLAPEVAKKYTSHSFRRTGATLLAEAGCTVLQLKEAGGWSSSTVAEHYVAESKHTKLCIAHRLGLFKSPPTVRALATPTAVSIQPVLPTAPVVPVTTPPLPPVSTEPVNPAADALPCTVIDYPDGYSSDWFASPDNSDSESDAEDSAPVPQRTPLPALCRPEVPWPSPDPAASLVLKLRLGRK